MKTKFINAVLKQKIALFLLLFANIFAYDAIGQCAITGLRFTNTSGGTPTNITTGGTYYTNFLPATYILEAITTGTLSSVRFTVTGSANYTNTDNTSPWRSPASGTFGGVGTYTVLVQSYTQDNAGGTNCSSATFTFTIAACSSFTASILGENLLCTGTGTTLTASTSTPGSTYAWTVNTDGTEVAAGTTPSITVNPANAARYTVTATNAAGCTATASAVVYFKSCSCTTNLLVNGSFDNGMPVPNGTGDQAITPPVGWVGGLAAIQPYTFTNNIPDGSGFGYTNTTNNGKLQQDVNVAVGKIYTLTFYGTVHNAHGQTITLQFLNAAGVEIGTAKSATIASVYPIWTNQLTLVSDAAPANAAKIRVSGNSVTLSGTNHVVKIDNACLTTPSGPLPINLQTFTAQKIYDNVVLNWKTSNEANFSHFEVQKSENLNEFISIGEVKTNQKGLYNFTDRNPNIGNNYYRLKMVDNDGSFVFSKTLSVDFNKSESFLIVENPAVNGEINVITNLKNPNFNLFNSMASRVNFELKAEGENKFKIKANNYIPGIYYLTVQSDEKQITRKIIFQ